MIQSGQFVLLYFNHDNIVQIVTTPGKITNHKYGNFHHDDIIGKEFGGRVDSRGKKGWTTIFSPSPEMITLSLPHRTQIIYHADIALIIALLDIHPGSRIIEAGTGSGSLSTSIAHCVRPTGRLFTFEFHEERHKQAVEFFEKSGSSDVISSFCGDACEKGFAEEVREPVDGVFLDLPTPWAAIKNSLAVLKEGGRICTFSPCIEQVQRTVEAIRAERFFDIRTFECICKPWALVNSKKKRQRDGTAAPRQMVQLNMRGHTSYITFATVALDDDLSG